MPLINRVPPLTENGSGGEEGGGSEVTPSAKKCGATVDSFIGDSNDSGTYVQPVTPFNWDSSGESWSSIGSGMFQYKFYYNLGIRSADFSNVKTVGEYCFDYAFYQCYNLDNVNFSGINTIDKGYAFRRAFYRCLSLSSVDFSGLETINSQYCFNETFNGCTYLSSVDFSGLKYVDGDVACFYITFNGCTNLTSVNFNSLERIAALNSFNSTFNGCTNLTSVGFDNLKTITGYMNFPNAFNNSGITKLKFPSLISITNTAPSTNDLYATFYGNNTITVMEFPKLSSITGSCIFNQCSNLTEIHFPASSQSDIEASEGYATLWGRGAGNATVYFDL